MGAVGERDCHRPALQRVSADGATLAGAGHAVEDARRFAAVQALRSRTLAYREERIVSMSKLQSTGWSTSALRIRWLRDGIECP